MFPWWDDLLHWIFGLILGFVGFLILYFLREAGRLQTSRFFLSLLAFSFAMSAGALWEIYEFSMDQLFGTSMQFYGLVDTMRDLILDALGALAGAIIGYIYLRRPENKQGFFSHVIESFMNKNPYLRQ